MSRCFPYPPPNYRKEEISKSLATESIKLEKERDLTKESRKEKKGKKERKEKRDKSKGKSESSKHREHGHKKRKHDGRSELQTKDSYQKTAAKDVIEQFEKSGLTEEHGLPCPMLEPCESSESTQNSSKSRKLEAANVTGGSHGSTILRLRLPLQKHRDPKPTPVNDEPCFSGRATYEDVEVTPSNDEPCFSDRATEPPMGRNLCANNAHSQSSYRIKSGNKTTEVLWEQQLSGNVHSRSSAMVKSNKTTEVLWEQQLSGNVQSRSSAMIKSNNTTEVPMELELRGSAHSQASATIKSSKPFEAPVDRELVESSHRHSYSRNKGSKRTRELERQFRDLVMNWKAPPFLLNAEPGTEDLGWISEKSGQCSVNSDAAQSFRVSSSVEQTHGSGASNYQTRACYLPELEMYQLPYVVPL